MGPYPEIVEIEELIYKRIAYILDASCITNLQMDCR